MPWEWAMPHMIAGVTAAPRWQWSSARGTVRDRVRGIWRSRIADEISGPWPCANGRTGYSPHTRGHPRRISAPARRTSGVEEELHVGAESATFRDSGHGG